MIVFPITFGGAIPNPASISGIYAWYKAGTGMFDGTVGGNAVGHGSGIARWQDTIGTRHLYQGTSATRPKYNALEDSVVSEVGANQYFDSSGNLTLNNRDFSIFFIGSASTLRQGYIASLHQYHFLTQSVGDILDIHYDGVTASAGYFKISMFDGSIKSTTLVPNTTEPALIGVVGTTDKYTAYMDNENAIGTVLVAGTSDLTYLLGANNGHPSEMSVRDIIIYNRALTGAEVSGVLIPYSKTRGAKTRNGQIIFEGDSITHGYGATLNQSWPSKLTIPYSMRRKNTAEAGIYLSTLVSNTGKITPLYKSGENNIMCVFAGTNDIALGGATGSGTYSSMLTICSGYKAYGFKVVTFTMLDRNFGGTEENYRTTFNTLLRANWSSFANAIVDVDADSRLSDSANTTYFLGDQIHPNNSGLQVIAELAQVQITTLL